MRGEPAVHHRPDAAGLVTLPLALDGPCGDLLAQCGQFGGLGPFAFRQRAGGRIVLGSGPGPGGSVRGQAGEELDQVPLPPHRALGDLVRQVFQQRGRRQRGAVAGADHREVLGRLEMDLVHEHAAAVGVGQPDLDPAQADDGIGVLLETDSVAQPKLPRPSGSHARPRATSWTGESPPNGAEVRSVSNSCRQSR